MSEQTLLPLQTDAILFRANHTYLPIRHLCKHAREQLEYLLVFLQIYNTEGFTLTVYRHAVPGSQERAAEVLGKILNGAQKKLERPPRFPNT